MTDISDLTIVIPSYNRHRFIDRLINYWANRGPQIIIIDGSAYPQSREGHKTLPKNITYIHSPTSLINRINQAAAIIETRFSLLGCDDEFYLPVTLTECIKYLKKNENLVSCCGLVATFCQFGPFVLSDPLYQKLESKHELPEEPSARLLKHMSNYVPRHTYSVFRTKNWRTIWNAIGEHEFHCFAIQEIQFEILSSLLGSSGVIHQLMWLRSNENTQPIRGTDPCVSDQTISDWWFDLEKEKERDKFLTIMGSCAASMYSTKSDFFKKIISTAIEIYCLKAQRHRTARGSFPSIKRKIPWQVRSFIKLMKGRTLKNYLENKKWTKNAYLMNDIDTVFHNLKE